MADGQVWWRKQGQQGPSRHPLALPPPEDSYGLPAIPQFTSTGRTSKTWTHAQQLLERGIDPAEESFRAEANLLNRVVSGVSWAFNIYPHALVRATEAVERGAGFGGQMAAVFQGIGESFHDPDTKRWFWEQIRHGEIQPTFVDYLQERHGPGAFATVAGLALDIITDPTMYVGIGALRVPAELGAKIAGKTAARVGARAARPVVERFVAESPHMLGVAAHERVVEAITRTVGDITGSAARFASKGMDMERAIPIAAQNYIRRGMKPEVAKYLGQLGLESVQEAMTQGVKAGLAELGPRARFITPFYGAKLPGGLTVPGGQISIPGSEKFLEWASNTSIKFLETNALTRPLSQMFRPSHEKTQEFTEFIRIYGNTKRERTADLVSRLKRVFPDLTDDQAQAVTQAYELRSWARADNPQLPAMAERVWGVAEGRYDIAKALPGINEDTVRQLRETVTKLWQMPDEEAAAWAGRVAAGEIPEVPKVLRSLGKAAATGDEVALYKLRYGTTSSMLADSFVTAADETLKLAAGEGKIGKIPALRRLRDLEKYLPRAWNEIISHEAKPLGRHTKKFDRWIEGELARFNPQKQELQSVISAIRQDSRGAASELLQRTATSEDELTRLERMTDAAWGRGGLDVRYRPHYLPGMAKRAMSSEGAMIRSRLGPQTASWQMPKKYDTPIVAWLAEAYEPELNIVKLLYRRGKSSLARIGRRDFLANVRTLGRAAEEAAEDWVQVAPVTIGKQRIGFRELAGLHFEPAVAEHIQKTVEVMSNPDEWDAFFRVYDHALNYFKGWATAPRPGFHMLNLSGNMFNSFLLGLTDPTRYAAAYMLRVGPENINPAVRKALELSTDVVKRGGKGLHEVPQYYLKTPGGLLSFEELRREVNQYAVRSGWFSSEVKAFEAMETPRQGPTSIPGRAWQAIHPVRHGRQVGEAIEDVSRMALYIDARAKGLNALDATFRVKQALFDYQELTQTERRVMRRAMPFYTWNRKNFPLQVWSLVTEPHKLGATLKGMESMRGFVAESERVPAELRPFYLNEMFAVQMPWKREGKPVFMSFNLPFLDMNRALRIGEWLGQLSPFPMAFIEAAANHSFWSERPIEHTYGEYQRGIVRAPWWVGLLTFNGKLTEWIENEYVFPYKNPKTGEEYLAMPARYKYVIERMQPFLASLDRSIFKAGAAEPGFNFLRLMTNVRLQTLDVERQKARAVGRQEAWVQQKLPELRGRGIMPPEEAEPQPGAPEMWWRK